MTLFLHDPLDQGSKFERLTLLPLDCRPRPAERFHLLREKIAVPDVDTLIRRPRLDDLVERSLHRYPGTLVSGRSGTGKTALAAQVAERYRKVAWYRLDALDADWEVFRSYFSASVAEACGTKSRPRNSRPHDSSGTGIAQFLVETFAVLPVGPTANLLIVLDDMHHAFDASWFDDFLQLLLVSLPPEAHLLMLCRSKPPSPLWRLRSKQVLNVIDEKLLAFTNDEALELLRPCGLATAEIQQIWQHSFGRVSNLVRAGQG